jgi:hypothetical protein
MTAIRKTSLQVAYFQGFTNLITDLCTSNDRFGFNRVFILQHCYGHFCGHGVGFRQLLDYYFVLKQGFTGEERSETAKDQ